MFVTRKKGSATILGGIGLILLSVLVEAQQPVARINRSFAGKRVFQYDADGACGPAHYAQITNQGLLVLKLVNGAVAYNADLGDFWTLKAGIPITFYGGFDPHIEYDHASARWFAITLSETGPESAVLVGVSDTSDPSGTWKGFVVDADPQDLRDADYPHLGIDGAAIYIRLNMFPIVPGAGLATTILTIPKADLTSAAPTANRVSRLSIPRSEAPGPMDLNGSLYPQIDFLGTSSDGLLLRYPSTGEIEEISNGTVYYKWRSSTIFQRMTGQATGAAVLSAWATTPDFVFQQTPFVPPPASWPADAGFQPGTTHLLGNNLGNNQVRVGDFVYSIDTFVVAGRVGLNYLIFQTSMNSVVDSGFIGDGTHDHLQPSIGANPRGDVVIVFLRTSRQEFPSLYACFGRKAASSRLVFENPLRLKAGSNIFDENGPKYGPDGPARFSDYSTAVSIHPTDHARFWVSGPYVPTRNKAETWISEILTGPPALPFLTLQRTGVGNADVELRFDSELGRTYRLQRSTTLSAWQTIQSGIAGTAYEVIRKDPGMGSKGTMFWRLQVD